MNHLNDVTGLPFRTNTDGTDDPVDETGQENNERRLDAEVCPSVVDVVQLSFVGVPNFLECQHANETGDQYHHSQWSWNNNNNNNNNNMMLCVTNIPTPRVPG